MNNCVFWEFSGVSAWFCGLSGGRQGEMPRGGIFSKRTGKMKKSLYLSAKTTTFRASLFNRHNTWEI
jgi:hypothetical protein